MKSRTILILVLLVFLAVAVFSQIRPTNDWKIVFRTACGEQRSETVESTSGVDGALEQFRTNHPKDDLEIVGVCRISYVTCN